MIDNMLTDVNVYVLNRQVIDPAELSRFLEDHGVSWESDSDVGAEVTSEVGGRVCYMSFAKPRPGGNAAYLKHIKEVGHGSVLEHAVWTLIITGVSRSLSHELVRHRAGWAYSQLSQRYVDESEVTFVVPPDLEYEVTMARQYLDQTKIDVETATATFFGTTEERPSLPPRERIYAGLRWLRNMYRNREDYKVLAEYQMMKVESELAKRYRLDPEYHADDPDLRASELGLIAAQKTEKRKFARQSARSVLPNATETKIQVTVNARAARHFIELRASRHADPEIRRLAYLMWTTLALEAPNLFSDYQTTRLLDGTYELTTSFPKV